MHTIANLRKARLLRHLFLGVIVTRQPPRRVVARHSELRALLLDEEVIQVLLLREFIAKSNAVVINAEADNHRAVLRHQGQPTVVTIAFINRLFCRLRECHRQFVVMVSDGGRLAPDGCPCLVEGGHLRVGDIEVVHQVVLFHLHRGVLVLGQFQTEVGRQDDGLAFIVHFIHGPPLVEREHQFDVPAR